MNQRLSPQVLPCISLALFLLCAAVSVAYDWLSYDTASEVELKGVVVETWRKDCPMGKDVLHLRVESGDRFFFVCVGPASFVEKYGFPVRAGDKTEVTGAIADIDGTKTVITRKLGIKRQYLNVRDDKGKPNWIGLRS